MCVRNRGNQENRDQDRPGGVPWVNQGKQQHNKATEHAGNRGHKGIISWWSGVDIDDIPEECEVVENHQHYGGNDDEFRAT